MSRLGDNVYRLREAAGLSQADLAKRVELSQTHVSRIERGLTEDISVRTLTRMARELGVSLFTLIGEDDGTQRRPWAFEREIPSDTPAHRLIEIDAEFGRLARLIFSGAHSPNPPGDRRDDESAVNVNGAEDADGYLNRHSQTRNNSLFGHDRLPVLDAA